MRLLAILICAFLTVSLLISCDETEVGGGGYKDPTQSDIGSEKTEEDDTSDGGANEDENEGGAESDTENGDGGRIPTVEFPTVPFG